LGATPERVIRGVGDVAGGRGELAQDRPVPHDACVMPDVGGGGYVLDQLSERVEAADVVEFLYRGQRLERSHHVSRFALRNEADDVVIDEPVRLAVEVGVGNDVG